MEKLDATDKEILKLLQKNCKLSAKQIAKETGSLTTTVYAKIRRMEKLGFIRGYHAMLDPKKMDRGVTDFILVSFSYRPGGHTEILPQREIAEKIAKFPEVQEVHMVAGEWDMMIKTKAKDLEEMGRFVIDKLRKTLGVEKVVSVMTFETIKERCELDI